jgi:hypothetical protein
MFYCFGMTAGMVGIVYGPLYALIPGGIAMLISIFKD